MGEKKVSGGGGGLTETCLAVSTAQLPSYSPAGAGWPVLGAAWLIGSGVECVRVCAAPNVQTNTMPSSLKARITKGSL